MHFMGLDLLWLRYRPRTWTALEWFLRWVIFSQNIYFCQMMFSFPPLISQTLINHLFSGLVYLMISRDPELGGSRELPVWTGGFTFDWEGGTLHCRGGDPLVGWVMEVSVSNDNSSNLVVRKLDILLIHGQPDKEGIKLGHQLQWEIEVVKEREWLRTIMPMLLQIWQKHHGMLLFGFFQGRIKEWQVKGQEAFVVVEGGAVAVPQMPHMEDQSTLEAPPYINQV